MYVEELTQHFSYANYQFQSLACSMLEEAVEVFLVGPTFVPSILSGPLSCPKIYSWPDTFMIVCVLFYSFFSSQKAKDEEGSV